MPVHKKRKKLYKNDVERNREKLIEQEAVNSNRPRCYFDLRSNSQFTKKRERGRDRERQREREREKEREERRKRGTREGWKTGVGYERWVACAESTDGGDQKAIRASNAIMVAKSARAASTLPAAQIVAPSRKKYDTHQATATFLSPGKKCSGRERAALARTSPCQRNFRGFVFCHTPRLRRC